MKAKITNLIFIVIISTQWLNAQDTWVKLPNFNGNRSLGVSFSIGNKIYFGQGRAGGTNTVNDFWEFDFSTQTWKAINTIPGNALIAGTAFSYKNYGFVGLGQTGPTTFSKAFYRFNSDSNNWVRIADFPGQARNYASFFVLGNKAYVGCGYNGLQTYNDFYCLNLDSNYWSKISDLPGLPRAGAFHFSSSGKGYVLCGGNFTQSSGNILLKDFFQFDPLLNKWTQISDFPGENREDGISFSFDLFGLIALGRSEVGFTNEVWEFNGSTQTWTNRNFFSGALRRNSGYSVVNNKGYVVGGNLGSGFTSEFYQYNPLTTSLKTADDIQLNAQVFPNPFNQNFTILGLNENSEYLIELYDMKGANVSKLNYQAGVIQEELEPGSYFLRLMSKNDSKTFTTIIVKLDN